MLLKLCIRHRPRTAQQGAGSLTRTVTKQLLCRYWQSSRLYANLQLVWHLNTKSVSRPPMAHLVSHHVKVQALVAGVQQRKTRVQDKEGGDDYVEQDLPRQALRGPGVGHQEQQGAGQHAVHCRARAADSMEHMLHTADAVPGLQVLQPGQL